MKREVLCEPCDKRLRDHLARAFGDFLAPVGEHVKRVKGMLLRTCMCDSCAEHLVAGERAVAVSMWSDNSGGPYFAWESEFLAPPSNPGDYYDRKREELRAALDALRAAQERGAEPEEIRRLERTAEQAAYVGD